LHGLADPSRKISPGLLTTLWTDFDFGLMFRDPHSHWRQIEDLTPLMFDRHSVFQIALAMAAMAYSMDLDFIRISTQLQCLPFVSGLTPTFLAARFPQTACAGWFLQSITRWRFAAVLAVFG
jgi:hypothetical protein